jgi:hypothetical protein
MGGNVFKDSPTSRLNTVEYFLLVEEFTSLLKTEVYSRVSIGNSVNFHVLENVRNKTTFGDCDILCVLPDDEYSNKIFPATIQHYLNISDEDFSKNGDVISIRYKNFQFDLILTPAKEFDIAKAYFNCSDSGNLIGKLVKQLGLKYGHNGLWYVFRNGDQVIDNILISLNPEDVFSLVGLDYDRFKLGFDTIEDLYEFVATSSQFRKEIYSFENVNAVSRIRDKKRPTYTNFLIWLDKNFADSPPKKIDRAVYLPRLFDIFPKFKSDWFAARHKMLDQLDYKRKFNGNIVSNLTGLVGQRLGEFMAVIKFEMNIEYVLTQSEKEIENKILELFKYDWTVL